MRNFSSYENIAILLGQTGVGPGSDTQESFGQLSRIQNLEYSFSFNRLNLNQISSYDSIDIPVNNQPEVRLQLSYYATSGENESLLGFYTGSDASCLYGMHGGNGTGDSRSIFVVSSERANSKNSDINLSEDLTNTSVFGFGNAFLDSYSFNASVGDFPTIDAEFSCSNLIFKNNEQNTDVLIDSPSVDLEKGIFDDMPQYFITKDRLSPNIGQIAAINPGDIELVLDTAQFGQHLSDSISKINVQSISINFPIGRNSLNGFGSNYSNGKKIISPSPATVSILMYETDIIDSNLNDIFQTDKKYNFEVKLKNRSKELMYKYIMRGARLISQAYSSSIGSYSMVDLQFVCETTPFYGLSMCPVDDS